MRSVPPLCCNCRSLSCVSATPVKIESSTSALATGLNPTTKKKEQGNRDGAGEKSRKISVEALSSHGGMIGCCASEDFGTASSIFPDMR